MPESKWLIGTLKAGKHLNSRLNTSLTLSNTKRGTDLGTLVIQFNCPLRHPPVIFMKLQNVLCEPCGNHLKINFPWISGQSKARRNLFDHKIRLRAPIRSRERYLHLHEPNQRRDHLRYRALRVNQRNHWSQPQGPSSFGNKHFIFVIR